MKEVGGLDTSVKVLARQIRSVLEKGRLNRFDIVSQRCLLCNASGKLDYQELNKLSSLLQSSTLCRFY